MTKTLRNAAVSVLLAAGLIAPASAGTLTFQGVTFTSSWSGNVLTLEIDAANPSGDWLTATSIGALQIKGIGTFDSVSLSAAPGAAVNWTLSSNELNAKGCEGGAHVGSSLCYSGARVALTDDMLFHFTFQGGATDFTSPHVKVNFFGEGDRKVGSLLSMEIPPGNNPPPIPEPQTYALLLGGLAAMGLVARRRKAVRV